MYSYQTLIHYRKPISDEPDVGFCLPKLPPLERSKVNFGEIYLLRHEQRGADTSYESSLTPQGLFNSETTVCSELEKLNIRVIYCSPFKRTLQTIRPFCLKYGLKVNLEWALIESIPDDPKILDEFDNIINKKYIPYMPAPKPPKKIINWETLKERTNNFVKSLRGKTNVLLVTHMPVINAILNNNGLSTMSMFTTHNTGAIIQVPRPKY